MSIGTGPGGNIFNIGPFSTGSSNVEPGSRYGQGFPSSVPTSPSSLNDPFYNMMMGMGRPEHGMLMDQSSFEGGPVDFSAGGHNNGLGLSGSWASSGFGQQQGMTSGFNFFNPSGTPSIPGSTTQFPAFGIGSTALPGVSNPSSPFSSTTGFSGTGGFPGLPSVDAKSLDKIYGKGVGSALAAFLSSGAGFNPAVMQAQLNAAKPIEAKTLSKMQTMFGDTGSAYSSTAAIGYGDFEAQFNAALQGEFAQEYQQSVQNYLNVLMGVKGDAMQQHAQEPNWLSVASDIAKSIVPFFA